MMYNNPGLLTINMYCQSFYVDSHLVLQNICVYIDFSCEECIAILALQVILDTGLILVEICKCFNLTDKNTEYQALYILNYSLVNVKATQIACRGSMAGQAELEHDRIRALVLLQLCQQGEGYW